MQSVNNPCTDNVVCLFAVLHSELFTSCEKTHTERWKVRNKRLFQSRVSAPRRRTTCTRVGGTFTTPPAGSRSTSSHILHIFVQSVLASSCVTILSFFYFHHFSRLCKLNICCVLIRTGRGNPPEVSSFLFPAEVLRTVLCEL